MYYYEEFEIQCFGWFANAGATECNLGAKQGKPYSNHPI